jgi:hypothetical protein
LGGNIFALSLAAGKARGEKGRTMSQDQSSPTAEHLCAQLVQANREIRGLRETLISMRARRADLRDRLKEARAAGRREAADSAPDLNRDVGGEA